ncbi:MAG: glycosyltransferase family 2 protein [Bacteroidota bacterium]
MKLAVLLTCFNRKHKTLHALKSLYEAQARVGSALEMDVFLTDDGSTDGTSEAVIQAYPQVHVLQGNGELFWAGGMRNSWKQAMKESFDAYFLLNDDTILEYNVLQAFLDADSYCKNEFGRGGIYIGSTQDSKSGKLTYGGAKLTNRFTFKYHHLPPNGSYQPCELGNANILFVSHDVVEKVGTLSEGYRHGVADYDYTLKAAKKNLPVLVMPTFLGVCDNDHSDIYQKFAKRSFKERLKIMKSPIGLDFSSNLNLMRRHFPVRVPFVVLSALLKLCFPHMYINLSKNR